MKPLVPFLLAGAVGYFVLSRERRGSSSAPASGPQPLRAGVPYLFIVRLDTDVTDAEARAVLESKRAQMLVFAPATEPPFWASQLGAVATGVWSQRIASFKATPEGNGSATLGDAFYGIGRLESLVRLDGLPFSSEGPSV